MVTISQNGKITSDEFVRISDQNLYRNPIRSICPYDDDTMLIGIDGQGVYQISRDGRALYSSMPTSRNIACYMATAFMPCW